MHQIPTWLLWNLLPQTQTNVFSIIFSLIIIIIYTFSTSPLNTLFMLQWLVPRISVQFLGRIPQPIIESHFLTPVIIAASTKTHLNYSAAWSQCNKSHRRKYTKDTVLKASSLPQKILEKNYTYVTPIYMLHYRLEILKGTVYTNPAILALLYENEHSEQSTKCLLFWFHRRNKFIHVEVRLNSNLIFSFRWTPLNAWYISEVNLMSPLDL